MDEMLQKIIDYIDKRMDSLDNQWEETGNREYWHRSDELHDLHAFILLLEMNINKE